MNLGLEYVHQTTHKNFHSLNTVKGVASGISEGSPTCSSCAFVLMSVASQAQLRWEKPQTPPPPHERQPAAVEKNLKVFDTLDFDVFSNPKWDRLQESHAKDIVVTWLDGHETTGIEKHIEDLKAFFVFAPDLAIKYIRSDSGRVRGPRLLETGTFTKPMPTPDGKTIAPTGNRFAIGMVTIGHWKNGKMDP